MQKNRQKEQSDLIKKGKVTNMAKNRKWYERVFFMREDDKTSARAGRVVGYSCIYAYSLICLFALGIAFGIF